MQTMPYMVLLYVETFIATIDVDLCTSGHRKVQRVSVLAERVQGG